MHTQIQACKNSNMISNFKRIFESRYTWIEGFMRNVRRFGDKTAMIDPVTNRQWTYAEVNANVNRLCHALAQEGVGKGDVVMVQMLNCSEFVFAYVACHKLQSDEQNLFLFHVTTCSISACNIQK